MEQKNSGWTKPKPAFFSGSYKDLEMSVSPDGQKLFFCSNRPLNKGGELKKDFDIWYLLRVDGRWSDPIHAGPIINSRGNEWYPTVSRNGTLYFCGREKPGLYKSDINNKGNYDAWVMIGDLRKTDIIGGHPYIAPDESYLITSAINGYDTNGGWDLFISFRKSDGSWTRSLNLGGNVNTKASEDFPCISPDGKYLFFTRLFKDDDGNDIGDIYWVDATIIEELKPDKLRDNATGRSR
jgi:Tol biopolymer transport system component